MNKKYSPIKCAVMSFLLTMFTMFVIQRVSAALVPCSINTFNVNAGLTNASGLVFASNYAVIPGTTNITLAPMAAPTNVILAASTNYFYSTNVAGFSNTLQTNAFAQTYSGAYFVIPGNDAIFTLAFTGQFIGQGGAGMSNIVLNFDGSLDGVSWQSNVFTWVVSNSAALGTTMTNPFMLNYSGRANLLYLGLNQAWNTNASGVFTNVQLRALTKPTL